MLMHRVIVCLDVRNERVVKGVRFEDLRDLGHPPALAAQAEADGADEIVFLDIDAGTEERTPLLEAVRCTAERLFIPLTVGGGVRTADDIGRLLRAGADKVSVNTAAVEEPRLLSSAASRFGAQCVVVSIDARRDPTRATRSGWRVYTHGGRTPTALDAVEWAGECARRGAGEVLLTSIDQDGTRAGYDLPLTRAVAGAVGVPVVASGGAGTPDHVCDALMAGADAALVAGIVHERHTTVRAIKERIAQRGLNVRWVA
jgi:cyclase